MARSHNGTSHRLSATNSASIRPELESFSVAFWVRRGRTTVTEVPLGSGNATANLAGWSFILGAGGAVSFRVSDGTGNARTQHSSIFTDTASWHLLVADVDRASGVVACYFDNSSAGFAPNTSDSIASLGSINQSDTLAAGSTSASGLFFQGSVGPVAILKGRTSTSAERAEMLAGKALHQVWTGYELVRSYPMPGADLSEYSDAIVEYPFAATGATAVDGPPQSWDVNTEPVVASDDFGSADGTDLSSHAADQGQAWGYHPNSAGTLEVRGGAVSRPSGSTSGTFARLAATIPSRNVARFRVPLLLKAGVALGTDHGAMLSLRDDSSANTFLGFQGDLISGKWKVAKRIAGSTSSVDGETLLASGSTSATTYDLVAHVDGNRGWLVVDGKLVAAYRDDSSTFRDLTVRPGFRLTGVAEPASPVWRFGADLEVESPFAIVHAATGTPGSTTVGTYGGFHLPALVRTDNHLIAFSEARYGGGADSQVRDLVCYRSSISGVPSFGAKIPVVSDGSDFGNGLSSGALCANPIPFVLDDGTTIVLLFVRFPKGSGSFPNSQYYEANAVLGLTGNTATIWRTTSTDEGATWSAPVEITSQVKTSDQGGVTLGPGPGVVKATSPNAGRLICGYGAVTTPHATTPTFGPNYAIYSDDDGATWTRSAVVSSGKVGSEASIAELSDGSLLINNRYKLTDKDGRTFNASTDGGATWGADSVQSALRTPNDDIGSVFTSLSRAFGGTAYSHPNARRRQSITVRVGSAAGSGWSDANDRVDQPGRISGGTMLEWSVAAYSSTLPYSVGGTDYVGCAYVGGNRPAGTGTVYQDRLTVAAPTREWLGLEASSNAGTSAGTFAALAGAGSGGSANPGDSSGSFGALAGAGSGGSTNPGTSAGTFAALVGEGSSSVANVGTSAGTFSAMAGASAGASSNSGASAGTFPALVGEGLEEPGYSPNFFEVGLETYLAGALGVPVWSGVVPQSVRPSDLPGLVYTVVAGSSEVELDGPTDQCELLVQFDAYARTMAGAAALIESLRSVLQGYSGPMGDEECLNAARENQGHGRDPLPSGSGLTTPRRMVEYRLWFRESVPTFS